MPARKPVVRPQAAAPSARPSSQKQAGILPKAVQGVKRALSCWPPTSLSSRQVKAFGTFGLLCCSAISYMAGDYFTATMVSLSILFLLVFPLGI